MTKLTEILPDLKFQFNLEHPSIEECYQFGYECALAELELEDNPYEERSSLSEHWQEGWWAGFYGEKPLFDLETLPEEKAPVEAESAANDADYYQDRSSTMRKWLKITGALAASAIVGYQMLDLVA